MSLFMKRPTPYDISTSAASHTLATLFGTVYFLVCVVTAFVLLVGGIEKWTEKLFAILIIGGFIVWIRYISKQGKTRALSVLTSVNQEYGTKFESGKSIGFAREEDYTLFDPDSKKILFMKYNGHCVWVVDFAEISNWDILWNEKVKLQGDTFKVKDNNYRFRFYLNDLESPIVTMKVGSGTAANEWSHRINLLLAGKKLPDQK